MNYLDMIVAIFVLVDAGCLFTMHALSDPEHAPHWPYRPPYVRRGLFLWGAVMLGRGADLTWRAETPGAGGHMDWMALVATLVQTYCLVAGALAAARARKREQLTKQPSV